MSARISHDRKNDTQVVTLDTENAIGSGKYIHSSILSFPIFNNANDKSIADLLELRVFLKANDLTQLKNDITIVFFSDITSTTFTAGNTFSISDITSDNYDYIGEIDVDLSAPKELDSSFAIKTERNLDFRLPQGDSVNIYAVVCANSTSRTYPAEAEMEIQLLTEL